MTDTDLTYTAGTCSVGVGATSVVGVATLWAQPTNVRQWDMISIDNGPLVPIVASPVDDTHLTIPAWAGTAKAGVTYVIYQISPRRFVGSDAMTDVETMLKGLNTDGWYRYVNPAFAGPTEQGIVANEGQFALKFTTGQLWIMSGGVWVLTGTFKPFGVATPFDITKTYNLQDVATLSGSSYVWINPTPGVGQTPPNATYWALLAGVGATGPATLSPLAVWATGVAMTAGPPASYVSINGSSYECLVSHTSGVFATDLAAGKWALVASKGADALTYGGSSATSLAIATGSKDFTDVPLTLAYQVGNYVRASSAASGVNFMEGNLTAYSAGHFTINVMRIGGTGTHTDWHFSISGAPGSGDLLSTNNLADLASVSTALGNLGGAAKSANLSDLANASTALSNIGGVGGGFANKFRNSTMDVWQRGSSFTVTTAGAYTADGWIVVPTGASVTVNQAVPRLLTAHSLSVTGNTSVTDVIVKQRIEGAVVAPLASQNVTVQAWINNGTGASITPTLTVKHATAADNWGATATDVSAVSLQACASGAWTRVAYTFAASASSGNGLEVSFDFGNNFSTTGKIILFAECDIRATPGIATGLNSSPPSPELRPIGTELSFCQRYLPAFNGVGTNTPLGFGSGSSATGSFHYIQFPQSTRVPVTGLTINSASNFLINSSGGSITATGLLFGQASLSGVFVNGVFASGNVANTPELLCMNASGSLIFTGAEL